MVFSHAIIIARPLSVPFDVTSEGSKVGVGKDVGMLGLDVIGIVLEGLLPDCPVSHRPQIVYWRKTGKGDSEARNSLYASRSRGACPAVVSRARCPLNRTM